MRISENKILFETTGRDEYAHAGTIGIDSNLAISYGYDGGLYDREWTQIEKEELADYMITLWQRYKLEALNNS